MRRTVPITSLPTDMRAESAVEAACAEDITFVEEQLRRGMSVLVECDKEMSLFLYLSVRDRLKRAMKSKTPKLVVIDGRCTHAARKIAGPGEFRVQQLTEAIRGSLERTVIVLLHLDVLTTTHTGLTLEAREAIPLLYENPEAVLLGFRDPSFEIPKVIQGVFSARREIIGVPRASLPQLITQREAQTINTERFDPFGLYSYVSGLNPVRLRKLLSGLTTKSAALPGRDNAQSIYRQIRKQTVRDDVELPNVKLQEDIGGYPEVKQRIREDLI